MVGVRARWFPLLFGRFFMSADNQPTNKPDREDLRTKAFWIAFEMIFVFGIPAAAAVLISQWLIAEELIGDWILYAALALAFLISWIIVFFRVRRLSADLKVAEEANGEEEKA